VFEYITFSNGLYEAISREYVTRGLHHKIDMDSFIREVLSFSFDDQGVIYRGTGWYAGESQIIEQRIADIVRSIRAHHPRLKFMELGFKEFVVDSLFFHVYNYEEHTYV
jgi:hypothetical protein